MRQLKISKQITSRDAQSLDKYLTEISGLPMVSPEQEVILAKLIQEGDEEALTTLVRANLRFVVSVAKQYQNQGFSLGDLINEGNLGLIKAAKRFDETRGFKFISYAVWWIRQTILQALADQSRIVRVPLNRVGAISKLRRAMEVLEQKFERDPTTEELARAAEMTTEEVALTMRIDKKSISMDAPSDAENDTTMHDRMGAGDPPPDHDMMADSLRTQVQRTLSTLTRREADVLVFYFGLGGEPALTLEEIGDKYSLTRERVRQIKEKAIRRMRHTSRAQTLTSFLN